MTSGAGDVPKRPLTAKEAAALRFMLSVDDPRIDALRRQAAVASVIWKCTCGCATVSFEIDRSLAAAAEGLCSPAIEADTPRREDGDPLSLLVFLDDGWLSSLELVWYVTVIPEFPPPAAFEPPELRC